MIDQSLDGLLKNYTVIILVIIQKSKSYKRGYIYLNI